jgi:hypothetical protein
LGKLLQKFTHNKAFWEWKAAVCRPRMASRILMYGITIGRAKEIKKGADYAQKNSLDPAMLLC